LELHSHQAAQEVAEGGLLGVSRWPAHHVSRITAITLPSPITLLGNTWQHRITNNNQSNTSVNRAMGVQEYLESHDIDRSDVGAVLFIHTVLSAILVGSTWSICYFAWRHPPPQLGNKQVSNSILLNSVTKVFSAGLKRKAHLALVRRHLLYIDV
jgi:hypothetical protein